MKITTRQQLGWPATPAASAPCKSGLVIHYDGAKTPKGVAKWEHEQCLAYWHWCRRFHMQTSGYADIGYSYGCCPHGQILEGRGWGKEQAAQKGGNREYTSVTLMLGEGEDPTPAQIEGVRELRKWLMGKGMAAKVLGHRDVTSTSCPGNRLYARLKDFAKDPTPDKAPEKKEADMAADVWNHKIPSGPQFEGEWAAGTHLRYQSAELGELADRVKRIEMQQAEILSLLKDQAAKVQG